MKIFTVQREVDGDFDTSEVDKFLDKCPTYRIGTACALDLCTLFLILTESREDMPVATVGGRQPLHIFNRK